MVSVPVRVVMHVCDGTQNTVIIGAFAHIGVSARVGVLAQGCGKKAVSKRFDSIIAQISGPSHRCGDPDAVGEVGRNYKW